MPSITVKYQFVDGAHFFTSNDKDAKGLCAAHTDLATAFNEVTLQLNKLIDGASFKPSVPLEEFKEWTKGCIERRPAAIRPMAETNWELGKAA